MLKNRRIVSSLVFTAAVVLAVPALAMDINKSITIAAGEHTDGRSTVNGSISVGAGAVVDGTLETVNGTIRIDRDARVGDVETVNGSIRIDSGVSAEDLESVNGSIRLASNVTVDGEVTVVNGKITLEEGTKVADGVSNVNGEISLTAAQVGGDLETVNGDVNLLSGSVLEGDLLIEKPGGMGWFRDKRKPRVVIGENARVNGTIRLKREVDLYISDSAEVGGVSGEMSMDDAVRFSGNRP
jgi:hypothetical protein